MRHGSGYVSLIQSAPGPYMEQCLFIVNIEPVGTRFSEI